MFELLLLLSFEEPEKFFLAGFSFDRRIEFGFIGSSQVSVALVGAVNIWLSLSLSLRNSHFDDLLLLDLYLCHFYGLFSVSGLSFNQSINRHFYLDKNIHVTSYQTDRQLSQQASHAVRRNS